MRIAVFAAALVVFMLAPAVVAWGLRRSGFARASIGSSAQARATTRDGLEEPRRVCGDDGIRERTQLCVNRSEIMGHFARHCLPASVPRCLDGMLRVDENPAPVASLVWA